MSTNNPLKQIMDIRRDELPQTLLMSGYFFLFIATFWVLKPLKTGFFVQFYDQDALRLAGLEFNAAQAQMIAKVGNMVVAFLAATAFIYASRYFRRQHLSYLASGFCLLCFLGFIAAASSAGTATVWTFFWFGDLYNTLMLATFFAFLNDSVRPEAAKRLYGVVVLGGVAGGAFGAITLASWIESLSLQGWLWVSVGSTVAIMIVAGLAGRRFDRQDAGQSPTAPGEEEVPPGNPATSGARLVFGSKYFLGIVAIVGLYEMVSTIMDFQFTSTISHFLDGDAISSQFATVYAVTNSVGLFVQLFLTSFIMTRFGIGVALMVMPVAAMAGSLGFMVLPVLVLGSFLNTADGGFQYSINQSAREVLYTPTSKAEKYQAKAFIDMFVVRFAKAVAVGLSLAITLVFAGFDSVRWLSLLTLVFLAIWIRVVVFVGREFSRQTAQLEEPQAAAGVVSGSPVPDTEFV